jgi:hypothetical protein
VLLNRGVSCQNKDPWLAGGSGLLQIVGAFTVALAVTPPGVIAGVAISGLATGYNILVRSLVTSMMVNDITTLYTMISILEILGMRIADPLLAAMF